MKPTPPQHIVHVTFLSCYSKLRIQEASRRLSSILIRNLLAKFWMVVTLKLPGSSKLQHLNKIPLRHFFSHYYLADNYLVCFLTSHNAHHDFTAAKQVEFLKTAQLINVKSNFFFLQGYKLLLVTLWHCLCFDVSLFTLALSVLSRTPR